MADPHTVLLDEPSEGLAPIIVRTLTEAVGEIRISGITLLLADKNLKFCRRICDRGYILEKGRVVHRGTMEAIWADETVIKKYLVV
jgi:branched-chain amino acid transport system ATP-binding protein